MTCPTPVDKQSIGQHRSDRMDIAIDPAGLHCVYQASGKSL